MRNFARKLRRVDGQVRFGMGRVGLATLVILCVAGSSRGAEHTNTPRCQMTGKVTAAGTGEAIADVEIKVMTGMGIHKARVVSTRSAADGSYAIEVPLGHARAWQVIAPAGYWIPRTEMINAFATTRAQPIYTKHYVLQKGISWPIRVVVGPEKRTAAGALVSAYSQNDYMFQAKADGEGRATLTIPPAGGEFNVIFRALRRGSFIGDRGSLHCDSGFQPAQIASVVHQAQKDAYKLTDIEGKTATVQGAVVVERAGQAEVVFTGKAPAQAPRARGKLNGTVVDQNGDPIEGAHVAIGFVSKGGSGMSSDLSADTDQSGKFEIPVIRLKSGDGRPTRLLVVVTKDGYGGRDVGPRRFTPDEADFVEQVEPITLAPAASIRGVVVDPNGKPVEGAWVEPSDGYADRAQFTKTDSRGRFEVTNLSHDLHRIHVSYADYFAGEKFVADAGDDEVLIRLRDRRQAAVSLPEEIKVGVLAPGLEVKEWTDGGTHQLSDYRGKLVFLEFWGTWCGACVNGFPTLKGLIERYESSDVVFLGIHTAGTDVTQARKLLELKGLRLVTGMDQGSEILDGSTVRAYGVRGYPAQIIIGRNAKVAWSDQQDKKLLIRILKAAKELGISYPYAADISFEEKVEITNRINLHVKSQIIDELLGQR